MDRLISRLILYSDLPDCALTRIGSLYAAHRQGQKNTHQGWAHAVKEILDLATLYGFDRNLWQDYLTWVLLTHPNSFSLTCERRGAMDGSINAIVRHDLDIFLRLMRYDWKPMEEALGMPFMSMLTDYHAIPKDRVMYHRSASRRIRALSDQLAASKDAEEAFVFFSEHLRQYGAGAFGLCSAFRTALDAGGDVVFQPISNLDNVHLSDLVGYENQKRQLRQNVEAFVSGRPYNNMLLYGDAGTGKSTSVKAILNEYESRGLRVVELYKHQLQLLSPVIAALKARRYPFIILMDDLSFDEGEVEYKYLKAVIEGGLETRPRNIMLCATSNRRHLVRETWKDRADMEHEEDIHHSDTMEEKLSLAARFGCAIRYDAPNPQLYRDIVREIARRYPEIRMEEEELIRLAHRWELRHGGMSGRTAQQFINDLAGQCGAAEP